WISSHSVVHLQPVFASFMIRSFLLFPHLSQTFVFGTFSDDEIVEHQEDEEYHRIHHLTERVQIPCISMVFSALQQQNHRLVSTVLECFFRLLFNCSALVFEGNHRERLHHREKNEDGGEAEPVVDRLDVGDFRECLLGRAVLRTESEENSEGDEDTALNEFLRQPDTDPREDHTHRSGDVRRCDMKSDIAIQLEVRLNAGIIAGLPLPIALMSGGCCELQLGHLQIRVESDGVRRPREPLEFHVVLRDAD
ncbi:hypothetical protein PENTCL1PPCAC_773, partial [Pristionchus entomophagus]